MRLSKLEIREFRGIRCLDLEFSSDGILIYGPNGVGKSSILQAIEYLLTGTVERLTGEGTGRQSLKGDLHHKEAPPEECLVIGSFVDGGSEIRIRRSVDDGSLEVLSDHDGLADDELPQPIRSLQVAMESKQNLLSRDDLLRFIDAPDHERSKVLNDILRLSKIDSYRKTLQRVERNLRNDKKSSGEARDDARKTFYDELETEIDSSGDATDRTIASDATALEVVNELRAQYDANALDSLGVSDFTIGIGEPDQPSAHPLARTITADNLTEIVSKIDDFDEEVVDQFENLTDALQKLDSNPELRRDVRAQDLIEQGQKLVEEEADRCPLCLKDWSDGDLVDELETRRDNASKADHLRGHIRSSIDDIDRFLRKLERELDRLIDDLDGDIPEGHHDLGQELELLQKTIDNISDARNKLGSGDLLDIPWTEKDGQEVESEILPDGLRDALSILVDEMESVEEPEDRMSAYRTLVVSHDRYQKYIEETHQYEIIERQKTIAEEIHEEFQNVRRRLLDETLDEIQEEVKTLLDTFSDELVIEGEDIEFESTEEAIRLRIPFHDGERHRPNLLFSEGQQDIMGLALFLAMCRVVTRDDVQIVLLDDVLSSVDAEHRANVARILESEYGDEFQFIFTTHDIVWSRHLRRTDHIDDENVVHLSSWSYYAGVHQHIDITKPRENIDHHLANNDLAAAAAWSRKMAEFYTAKGCENFDVHLRFTDFEKLSLKDYLEGLMPELSELLDRGSTDAETVLDDTDVDDVLDTMGNMQGFIDRNLWGMNKNIHYSEPEVATFTETELRSNLGSFDEVFELVYCVDCDSWMTESDTGIECDCSVFVKT